MDKMENAAKSLLKGITGPLKLKEFIQAVRACKVRTRPMTKKGFFFPGWVPSPWAARRAGGPR